MGMKFVNALMLASILLLNVTGIAQAHGESYENIAAQRKGFFAVDYAYFVHTFLPKMETDSVTYLSDLAWTSVANGWGPAEKDKSNGETGYDGNTITLNGITYSKGLGVHAYSEISYDISHQGYELFVSDIGVDDEDCGVGSVIFKAYVDGIEKFNSGMMYSSSVTQTAVIDITGANELRLYVFDGGNGNTCDHADWAGARLLSGLPADADESTVAISPIQ